MAKKDAGKTVRYENPLMPDERLRQMYTGMVQVRMLEELLGARPRAAKAPELETIHGEEAARASTALSLGTGDLISDSSAAAGMDLLLGVELAALTGRGARAAQGSAAGESHAIRLPRIEDTEERMQVAVGAGAALKAQGGSRVVLAYVEAGALHKKGWKRVLGLAGRQELPVLFTVLPRRAKGKEVDVAGELSERSRGWGVPGFPVDGLDAIALYRVMQESLLRARAGGGPALMECVGFRVGKKAVVEDPIGRMEELIVAKGAATTEWLGETRAAFRRRLGTRRRKAVS